MTDPPVCLHQRLEFTAILQLVSRLNVAMLILLGMKRVEAREHLLSVNGRFAQSPFFFAAVSLAVSVEPSRNHLGEFVCVLTGVLSFLPVVIATVASCILLVLPVIRDP